MTSFVTNCPHCQTSFRVSRTQLAAAQGVVRCGACMELFNAARYLQEANAADQQSASPGAAGATPINETSQDQASHQANPAAQDDTRWLHDDLDLDSLDLDEELAKLERQELELSREFLGPGPQPGEHKLHLGNQPTDDDEAWAEQLLMAETDPEVGTRQSQTEPENTGDTVFDATDVRFIPVSAEHPAPPSPLAIPRDTAISARNRPGRAEPVVGDPVDFDENSPHTAFAGYDQVAAVPEPTHPTRNGHENKLFELDDEPLQLDWEERRRPWGRWLGWGALNLIALLALAAQYVAYNFDELARQDEYRPWLERICPALNCELPPLVDISQIKSSNLVVRSHPDFTGALVVDAIIYNRAPFAQPFPLLEVRFADIHGNTLAQRSFKPGEYLSGELAGQREMPSQIPIHIALDILDPGITAVNYSLSFSSPD